MRLMSGLARAGRLAPGGWGRSWRWAAGPAGWVAAAGLLRQTQGCCLDPATALAPAPTPAAGRPQHRREHLASDMRVRAAQDTKKACLEDLAVLAGHLNEKRQVQTAGRSGPPCLP
jgi:hypothetical protein